MSTFERAGGDSLAQPQKELMISPLRPKRPRTVVTGSPSAVTVAQRTALENALAYKPDPSQLRLKVARVSRDAAARANGKVGESCVVAHLLPDGSGEAQVFGNLTGEYLPALIIKGVSTSMLKSLDAPTIDNHRLVGVTWTASAGTQAMVTAYRDVSKQTGDGWPTESTQAQDQS